MTKPIVRIVRLTLRPEAVDAFHEIFSEASPVIRASAGCLSLELWVDARYPNIVTTHSRWESAGALAAYRDTAFFESIWLRTRALFAAPPFAASHHIVS